MSRPRGLACAVVVITGAWPAFPCDCVCYATPLDAASVVQGATETLKASRVIVLGRVVKLDPDPARDAYALPDVLERVATVEVVREWKGPRGYTFRLGEYLLLTFDDEPTRLNGCCGKGSVSDMRLLIGAYDKAARRKPLKIPDDLN